MEHNGKLVIVADMGELKCYKVQMITATNRYHLELKNDIVYSEGRESIGETFSDAKGQFVHGNGEDHGMAHEIQQGLLRKIADDISNILSKAQPASTYLAFRRNEKFGLLKNHFLL